ncbi:MAG: carboxypeptidase-like regulatory domain-containing protein [Mucilaginibacter sp.]
MTGVYGQTVTVKGTVHNQKEQPVPYAFVRDAQHNYATFTDSTGTFVLKADPASSLYVLANNYKDTQLKLDDKTNVNIVLPESTDEGGVLSLKSGQSAETTAFLRARQQLAVGKGSVINGGPGGGGGGSDVTLVRSGFAVEPTRGSRYLFDDWVPGFGINKKDSLVVEKTNMYNYDKIGGNIIYTNDGRSIAQVSPSQLKSFTLYDKQGHGHVYENAPAINGKPFIEVLLSTPKYKIYKKIDSKLTRADYHTDGVLEVGHRYDEYTDVNRYYFVALPDGKAQSISLKKSTLKKMLGSDADMFIASQGSRDVDEEYVRDLGNSLSK